MSILKSVVLVTFGNVIFYLNVIKRSIKKWLMN